MRFEQRLRDGISDGTITAALRRWRRRDGAVGDPVAQPLLEAHQSATGAGGRKPSLIVGSRPGFQSIFGQVQVITYARAPTL